MHSDRGAGADVPAAGLRIVVVEPRCLNRRLLVDWLHHAWPSSRIHAAASPLALDARELPIDLAIVGLGAASPAAPAVAMVLHELARRIDAAPLVVLGEREELAAVTEALRLGASGYIPTSFDPLTALRAIEFVLAGGTFVPARTLAEAGRGAARGADRGTDRGTGRDAQHRLAGRGGLPDLTPRERDVAAAVCAGKPNKIIAHELQISEATVKVFVRHILRKVGATNRTEAASAMRRHFGAGDALPGGEAQPGPGDATAERAIGQ